MQYSSFLFIISTFDHPILSYILIFLIIVKMERSEPQSLDDPTQQLIEMNKQLHQRRVDPSIIKKCQVFINLLMQEKINLQQLKQQCRNGIPEEAHRLRIYCWMVLLGILPPEVSQWKKTIQKLKTDYQTCFNEFINREKYKNAPYGEKNSRQLQQWNELKDDYYIWEQIQKDTMRTRSQLGFFCGSYNFQEVPFFKTGARKQKQKQIRGEANQEYREALTTLDNRVYRYDIMTKILFVFSKFNMQLRYVQGMNEILSPIFYITNLNQQKPHQWQCMCIFRKILEEIKELLIKQFDNTDIGIQGKLRSIQNKIMVIDYELWARLHKLEIKPFFYAFKWITLYFAQQFELFDLMILWDNIFTYENRQQYCQFLCVAVMEIKRSFILNNNFSCSLSHIQDNEQLSVRELIRKGRQLYDSYHKVNFAQEAKQLNATRIRIESAIQTAKYIKDKSLGFMKNIKSMFKK